MKKNNLESLKEIKCFTLGNLLFTVPENGPAVHQLTVQSDSTSKQFFFYLRGQIFHVTIVHRICWHSGQAIGITFFFLYFHFKIKTIVRHELF